MRRRRNQAGIRAAAAAAATHKSEKKRWKSVFPRYVPLFLVVLVAVAATVWILPSRVDPVAFTYSAESLPKFTGPLAVNDHLKRAKRFFENEFVGPEAFTVDHNGNIYSGLADGRIVRFRSGMESYTTVARTGLPPYDKCGPVEQEEHCGRVLGMQFHQDHHNVLFVVDSSHGLLKVNTDTGQVDIIASSRTNSEDTPYFNFCNDLVLLHNGSIFFTDSSKKYKRSENRMEVIECRPNGQLLHYIPDNGMVHVAADNLYFPNGLCVSTNKEYLLIAETTRARILRYYLTGRKAGTTDTFVENLPGLPDNISPSISGGYWVGFGVTRKTGLLDAFATMPFVRQLIAKFHLVSVIEAVTPKHALIVELDANGHIIRSLHDEGGDVTESVSHVLDLGNSLLLGSYHSPYIAKVDLSE